MRSSNRVWALTAALGLAAVVLHAVALPGQAVFASPVPHLPVFLTVTFALAETAVVHVRFRRNVHSWAMAEVPLVVGLTFSSPVALVASRLAGSAVALAGHRRQPPKKLVFNLMTFWLETVVAVLVFRSVLAGADPLDLRGWLAAVAATAAATLLVSGLAVPLAISLEEGRLRVPVFQWVLFASAIATLANTGLGLLAVTVLRLRPVAIVLVVLVAVVMLMGYRGYGSRRQRHDTLRGFRGLARDGGAGSFDSELRRLLVDIRALVDADTAAVALQPTGPLSEHGHGLSLGSQDRFTQLGLNDPLGDFLDDGTGRRGAVLISSDTDHAAARRVLDRYGAREAIVTVMPGTHRPTGVLLVANGTTDVRAFGREHLDLMRPLAHYAGVALENLRLHGRLQLESERRQHEARHDPLTGLLNRTSFNERLRGAINTCPQGRGVGLLLLDLDRFKDVNDTFGHDLGDVLLQRVGDRLQQILGPGNTVARLGGDEFTIQLTDVAQPSHALASARRIRDALLQPFRLGDLVLDVDSSMGVAWYPDHGTTPEALLQGADVAMYAAKLRGTGIELYDRSRDLHTPRRLTLLGQLRAAIDSGDLTVHYQPVVDLTVGSVVGVEALARWQHPEHGAVPPDEFIPMAENGGLIIPLTERVLRTALEQGRRWADEGLDIAVAVNLSVRTLLDPDLPGFVRDLLAETGVRPERLKLEITESCMVVDPVQTAKVLDELAAIGVILSIDDFGTGYSSLSALRGLPIDEIKIDRSFVHTMTSDQHNAVIVRLTTELGSNLGLRVVAEGVEDAGASEQLTAYGCDFAQGHLFGPAMAADNVRALLRPD